MISARSKRRRIFSLVFILKCVSKKLLVSLNLQRTFNLQRIIVLIVIYTDYLLNISMLRLLWPMMMFETSKHVP